MRDQYFFGRLGSLSEGLFQGLELVRGGVWIASWLGGGGL